MVIQILLTDSSMYPMIYIYNLIYIDNGSDYKAECLEGFMDFILCLAIRKELFYAFGSAKNLI